MTSWSILRFQATARGLSQLPNSRRNIKINLSLNICLVAANDVMEHFAFPGNIDLAGRR